MLFRKNKKGPHPGMLNSLRETVASEKRERVLQFEKKPARSVTEGDEVIRIDYEMMKKGSRLVRRGKEVRQFLVMVSGAVRLVTSGDSVDRETYDALAKAGVVDPLPDTETKS